ncbi:MAG: DUF3619 family protein [Betaproteobacteria bacterium]
MIEKNQYFAKKITAYLDFGSANLKAGTAYRLQRARAEALARLTDPKRASRPGLVPAFAGSGSGTMGSGRGFRNGARLWLGIALIVAAGIGYQQWQGWQQLKDIEETDAAILSSDLPIDAYLDRGFQNWLKTLGED